MKRQFHTIGLACKDSMIRLVYTSAATRLGLGLIAVDPEEDEAFEVLELYCDILVVETEEMVKPCKKPLLVASSLDFPEVQKAVEGLLYNPR